MSDTTAEDVRAGLAALGNALPTTMGIFGKLHGATMTNEAFPRSVSELIAVAISICTHCEGCAAYHLEEAVRTGATREQALGAIAVAIGMGGGPAAVYAGKAIAVLDVLQPTVS